MNESDIVVYVIVSIASLSIAVAVYFTGQRIRESVDRAAVLAERLETQFQQSQLGMEYKLDQIHTLVNSRLSTALAKIDALELRLFAVTGEMPTGEPKPASPTPVAC